MDLQALGNRIVERREKLHLTQRDVAAALQVSAQAVSKWERGENAPDVALLTTLSRVLGVSTDWLLGSYTGNEGIFEATVFASDLVGYTAITQQLEARDALTWLNARFFEITEVVLRHDGIPVTYVGDMFVGVFAGANHQDRAIQAGLVVQTQLGGRVRIGLDSGPVHMWTLGHPSFSTRDVVGRTATQAARLAQWSPSPRGQLAATAAVVGGASSGYGLMEQQATSLGQTPGDANVTLFTMASPGEPVALLSVANQRQ